MNRKDIIAVVNDQILPQVQWDWHYIKSAKELVKIISDYRSKMIKSGTAKITDTITAKVIDGYLYLDNNPITRIAPKDKRPAHDEISYHIEGRILARQEVY